MPAGIEVRHSRRCRAAEGIRCRCSPTYRVRVWDRRAGKLVSRKFDTLAEAKAWQTDARVAVRKGSLRPPVTKTVSQAGRELIAGMNDGSVLDRSGKPYKPSTCRTYAGGIDRYIEPQLGSLKLSEVRRRDVQLFVDRLRRRGLAPATVHKILDPLRVIFRQAVEDDDLAVDPTDRVKMPAARGVRDRIASPAEASALLDALPPGERALWSVLFYAGLRIGEVRGLRCQDVDFERNVIGVEGAWDDQAGAIEAKTKAGRRVVPMAARLRRELAAHKLRTGHSDADLMFGRTRDVAFVRTTVRSRARAAWRAAGLDPVTPHEARHCAVSYFIAAGMNPKQISTYIGHEDVRTTWNRYGHLIPGDEERAADQLDEFLERAEERTGR